VAWWVKDPALSLYQPGLQPGMGSVPGLEISMCHRHSQKKKKKKKEMSIQVTYSGFNLFIYVFLFIYFFRATPVAYGDSQARGLMGAAGLHHGNTRSLTH